MYKPTLSIVAIAVLFFSTLLADWPQCRNTSGGSPEQPPTIYLGDTHTFGCDSWGTVNGNWGRHRVVIDTDASIIDGSYGTFSGWDSAEHNTATSPRFTSIGTWYWGIELDYSPDPTSAWYCIDNSSWANMYGVPASDLQVTVTALNDPAFTWVASNPTNPESAVDLNWSKDPQDHAVMIVRSTSSSALAAWSPSQGTDYNDGDDPTVDIHVVWGSNGSTSGTDSGLSPGIQYYYRIFSENYQYYSAGLGTNTTDSETTDSPLSNEDVHIPGTFGIVSAYPNPFNPVATITYELSESSDVTMTVCNVNGQLTEMLEYGHQYAGTYSITFDGSQHPSGVYFVRLAAGTQLDVYKILLIK